MRKATVTYRAPEGDSKVVEMGGVTFFDGKEVELNSDDHPHLMWKGNDGQQTSKIEGNPHFDVEMGEEEQPDKPRRGRPPKVRDMKAGIEEARDHDFEKDRRANLAGPRGPIPGAKPDAVQNEDEYLGD